MFDGRRDGGNYWWVAPVYSQAEIAFRRTKKMLKDAGMPSSLWKSNDQKKTIDFTGCGTLWFKSAEKPDNLYGEDVYAAVLDEATRMREEAWHAVRSTLTYTRGPVRIISNVKGRGNWVYKLGQRARDGTLPDSAYAKLTSLDAVEAGIFPREEYEDAKASIPEHVFRQLYMAEPGDDGGNPFGIDHIARQVAELSDRPVEWWGVDLAKSYDYAVAIGLDGEGHVAYFDRWRGGWEHTTAKLAGLLKERPSLIDSTGVGDPIVERLQRSCPMAEGFKFTRESKQPLMEGLAVAIQNGEVWFPDGPIRSELESFEYEVERTRVRYSAPEGMHDDCVCALALAVQCRAQQQASAYIIAPSPAYAVGVADDDRGWEAWN